MDYSTPQEGNVRPKAKMTKSFIQNILLVLALLGCIYFYLTSKKTPPWTKPFTGARIVIKEDLDPSFSSSWVYEDIEKFQQSFALKKGDECFVLTSPEWKWTDYKDGFTLAPIFCPSKGAGWASPYILKN